MCTEHPIVAILFHSTVPRCYQHRISNRVTVTLTDNSHSFLQSLQEIARKEFQGRHNPVMLYSYRPIRTSHDNLSH
jgi:hypothetical protein